MMKIRPIEERDFTTLVQLFADFATFEKQPDKMVNSLEKMRQEKELIKGFVAETPLGEVVGYATCFFAYFTWKGKSLYMDDLYVKPDFRGQGLGTLLIKRVIEFAKTEHCAKVRWQVSEWNAPAIHFYKQLGAEVSDSEWNCDLSIV